MASGSYGTNADESIAHKFLQFYSARACGALDSYDGEVNGDDGVITFKGISADEIVRLYTSFGLDMNPSKQSISATECVYLRR